MIGYCCLLLGSDGGRIGLLRRVGPKQAQIDRSRAPDPAHLDLPEFSACACCAKLQYSTLDAPIPCISALLAIASLRNARRGDGNGLIGYGGYRRWACSIPKSLHKEPSFDRGQLVKASTATAWCLRSGWDRLKSIELLETPGVFRRLDRSMVSNFSLTKHVPCRRRFGFGELDVGVRTARLTHPRYTPHSDRDRRRPVREGEQGR